MKWGRLIFNNDPEKLSSYDLQKLNQIYKSLTTLEIKKTPSN